MSTGNWRDASKNSVSAQQLSQMTSYDKHAQELFPLLIPTFMAKNIDFNNPSDPILNQVLPQHAEWQQHPHYTDDPVGDMQASPVSGVIHKYHGRVLLIASGLCAVNCRYCFRRNFNYAQNHASSRRWKNAIEYISTHDDINEVILSGGDPLMLSTKVLTNLTEQLKPIKHVLTLRIHTRMPVVCPERINQNFLHWLQDLPFNKVMVIHCNHANELDAQLQPVFQSILQSKTVMLNQSVLLKGINDDAQILAQLSHKLFAYGVLPYYLNQLDKAKGTKHFSLSNKKAIAIHKKLLQLLPGYLVPKLVEEISGKLNKSPIN